MASLEELRNRIDGTKDLQSVVRVMKSLSAVTIGQYQAATRSLRDYQDVVDRSLQVALGDVRERPGASDDDDFEQALVAMGSDRGLCGRFNESIAEEAEALARRRAKSSGRPPIVAIGTRLAGRLEAGGWKPHAVFSQPGTAEGLGRTVEGVLMALDDLRRTCGVTRTDIIFSSEARGGGTRVENEILFPLDRALLRRIAEAPWPTRKLPMISGPEEEARSALIRERLFVTLLRTGAESLAAEHASRLAAMQAAERNISDKLDELEAAFRRERQDAITTELLDIVSAYECLGADQRSCRE
ncbi:MAG: F0F1 ATP synthase subunit gamma [Alphaproteobacteria bacterium]|nr:F0F1 ATP synthase subunit gamma [Alphaproteobacteria bacterium]